jgi:hypothetical protein
MAAALAIEDLKAWIERALRRELARAKKDQE